MVSTHYVIFGFSYLNSLLFYLWPCGQFSVSYAYGRSVQSGPAVLEAALLAIKFSFIIVSERSSWYGMVWHAMAYRYIYRINIDFW